MFRPYKVILKPPKKTDPTLGSVFFIYKNSIFCQGDMFRPYKIILKPTKKTYPNFVCLMKNKQILDLSSWTA